MHSDALNGGGEPIVSAGDLGLAEHSVDQLNLFGDDDAQGLPEQKEQLRRDQSPASFRDTGDDAGRRGRDASDLPGPAVIDGGAGQHGAVRDTKRASEPGEQESTVSEGLDFWIARVPVTHLDRVLQMGGDAGLGRVIEQTADETVHQVYTKLQQGQQQLWTIAEGNKFIGAAITQLESRDLSRVLVVKYLAGADMGRWVQELHIHFLAFAREQQCEAVEAFGREGWRKTLLALGWSKVAVLYRVAVNG